MVVFRSPSFSHVHVPPILHRPTNNILQGWRILFLFWSPILYLPWVQYQTFFGCVDVSFFSPSCSLSWEFRYPRLTNHLTQGRLITAYPALSCLCYGLQEHWCHRPVLDHCKHLLICSWQNWMVYVGQSNLFSSHIDFPLSGSSSFCYCSCLYKTHQTHYSFCFLWILWHPCHESVPNSYHLYFSCLQL